MKYKVVLTGTNDVVEVHTDHKYPVKLPVTGSNLSAGGLSGALVYRHSRTQWTHAGMGHLFKWLRAIDDTAVPEDVLGLVRMNCDPVDVLRIYSEADGMAWPT